MTSTHSLIHLLMPPGIVAAVLLSSCGAAVSVPAVTAQTGSVSTALTFSATANPEWTVAIAPNTAGKVMRLNVQLGQTVKEGDVLAELDKRSLQDATTQAEADVASARAKLGAVEAGARPEDVAAAQAEAAAAREAVADLAQGRPEAIAQARASLEAAQQKLAASQAGGRQEAIDQAQAKLDGDRAALDKLLNGAHPQDVTNARLAVEQAKDSLYGAQVNRDALCAGVRTGQTAPTGAPVVCQAAQAAVLAAQTAVDQANTSLAKVVSPPRSEDVAQARAAITADEQALALVKQPNRPEEIAELEAGVAAAQAQLDLAQKPGSAAAIAQAQQRANGQQALAAKAANPYTPQDLAQAQAAVQAAEAGLQSARTALSNATILAPADGTISDVTVAVGAMVGPTAPIASEVAATLELDADVAQDQVGRLRAGQPAAIQVGCDSVPGHVVAVAPVADAKTRSFALKVRPDETSPSLRAGMSASVRVETERTDSALLVPAGAVQSQGGRQVVFTAVAGKARSVAVETGVSTPTQVQVTAGLSDGDVVLLVPAGKLVDGQSVSVQLATPSTSTSSSCSPA